MREIRTLRAMWRALETGFSLKIYAPALDPTGKRRIQPRKFLRIYAPALDPTRSSAVRVVLKLHLRAKKNLARSAEEVRGIGAESRTAHCRDRILEVPMIPEIDEIASDLQPHLFLDGD